MTREQRRRARREFRRNLALLALVIIIAVGGTCLIDYLVPPVEGDVAEWVVRVCM